MSWSLSARVFGDTAEGDLEEVEPTGQDASLPHVAQAAHAAKQAAVALIRSGAYGTPGDHYHVTLSGHANPDHRPQSGWSNDCATIGVVQVSPES
jgi:hypothetical protein